MAGDMSSPNDATPGEYWESGYVALRDRSNTEYNRPKFSLSTDGNNTVIVTWNEIRKSLGFEYKKY